MKEYPPLVLDLPGGELRFDALPYCRVTLRRSPAGARPDAPDVALGAGDPAYIARRLLAWLDNPGVPLNEYGWLISLAVEHHALYVQADGAGGSSLMIEGPTGHAVAVFLLDAARLASWRAAVRAWADRSGE